MELTLQKAIEIKQMIESENFQDYIVKPIYDELEKLGKSYDCESLRELARIKGKKQGLEVFIKTLKNIDEDYKRLELLDKEA